MTVTEYNVTLYKQTSADDGMTELRRDVVLPIPPHVGMWVKIPADCDHVIREVAVATDTRRITCRVVSAANPNDDYRGPLADVLKTEIAGGWAVAGWVDWD